MNPKPRVFIGSAKEDLKIAKAIKTRLQASRMVGVKLWTDEDVFKLSGITLTSLFDALQCFDFAVLIATPDSRIKFHPGELPIPRDNVIYEMGLFAGRLGWERVFIAIPYGAKLHLATDLDGLTIGHYDPVLAKINPKEAASDVCKKILLCVKDLGVDKLTAYARMKSRKYYLENNSFLVQPSLSSIMGQSPFQFTDISDENRIFSANNEIFLAAQNHYQIICGSLAERAKTLIFDFLKRDRAKNLIRFLFCSPDYEAGVAAWNWVNAEDDNWKIYLSHLIEAIKEMKRWIGEAKLMGLKLEAKKANFIPLSVTFIDPREENAAMVIMPHAFIKVSPQRPCHFLTLKDNKSTYHAYYDNYNRIYYSSTASSPL